MIRLSLSPTSLTEAAEAAMSLAVANIGSKPCTSVQLRVAIPDDVLVIGGRTTFRVDRLDPGSSREMRLRVRPVRPGDRSVTVTDYSYTDGNSRVQRPTVNPWTVTVEPRPAADRPVQRSRTIRRDTVFICYRRNDTGELADMLHDQLSRTNAGRVFIDTVGVIPGEDFRARVIKELRRSALTIVLIGPDWRPERLTEEYDTVNLELLASLDEVPRVLPVLTRGAMMPTARSIPDDLIELTRLSAFTIHSDKRRADIADLVDLVLRYLRHRTD